MRREIRSLLPERLSSPTRWLPMRLLSIAALILFVSAAEAAIIEGPNPLDTPLFFKLGYTWEMDKSANETFTTPNGRNWRATLESPPVAVGQGKSLAISVTHNKSNDAKLINPNPNSLASNVGPLAQAAGTFTRKTGLQVIDHPLVLGETRKDADLLRWQVTVPPQGGQLATVELRGGHMADVARWRLQWGYTPVQPQTVRIEEAKTDGTPASVYKGEVKIFRPKPTPEDPEAEEYVRSIQTNDTTGAFNTEPGYIYRRAVPIDAPALKEVKVLSGSGTTETTLAYLAQDFYGLYSEADMAPLTEFLFPGGFFDVPDLTIGHGLLFVAVNLVEWAGYMPLDPWITSFDFDEFGRSELLPGVLACTNVIYFSKTSGFSCFGDQFFNGVANIAGSIGARAVEVTEATEPESITLVAFGLLVILLRLRHESTRRQVHPTTPDPDQCQTEARHGQRS